MAAQPAYRYNYATRPRGGFSPAYDAYRPATSGYGAYEPYEAYGSYGSAVPARRAPEPARTRPQVQVVPGRKHITNPVLSPTAVMVVKALIVCMILFLVVGFARVGLASGAYSVSSASSELRSEITQARAVSDSLAVEKGALVSPTNLREAASSQLALAAPEAYEQLTLSADVVVTNAEGDLSLSGSIARVAGQG